MFIRVTGAYASGQRTDLVLASQSNEEYKNENTAAMAEAVTYAIIENMSLGMHRQIFHCLQEYMAAREAKDTKELSKLQDKWEKSAKKYEVG